MQDRLSWLNAQGHAQQADWISARGAPPPQRVRAVGDGLSADAAWRALSEGTALLWAGDFQQAKQLLQALGRKLDRLQARSAPPQDLTAAFHRGRAAQAERAARLGGLLVVLDEHLHLPLRRAPDVQAVARAVLGPQATGPLALSLRELLGWIGSWEWRRQGVPLPALGLDAAHEPLRIHPHHGVFSPVRGEYLELLAHAPLPAAALDGEAFDIGTGTGVVAALLLRRGVPRVQASDVSAAALACADENLRRLGLRERVALQACDGFPDGRAGLLVCNPPWLPGRVHSALDAAVYDPDSRLLRAFLAGARAHLAPGGEAWLILSDLAEHLGLRTRAQLLGWMADGGLQLVERLETRPVHPRSRNAADPLHAARAAERTHLWRLADCGS